MNLLLDTHVLLWWLGDNRRLGRQARELISNGDNTVYVSSASAWEISIKRALGKLTAPASLIDALYEAGFEVLEISFQHGELAGALPTLHHDPFDRMLIAQAQIGQLSLVTADAVFGGYELAIIDALK